MSGLIPFITESNRIEGIRRKPTEDEIAAHKRFLAYSAEEVTVASVSEFVQVVAGAALRDEPGMDVQVGAHIPMAGGPAVRHHLASILADIAHPYSAADSSPYEAHVAYEQLHPFMDGNGRSGRVIWAWQMEREGHDPFVLPFLHRFYYQALDASRD